PTGSRKTSLLDILADRKDRQCLTGKVLIDGEPQLNDSEYRIGYVVQDNILSGTLTVRENLTFSANLRSSNLVAQEEKRNIVNQVICQLRLNECADSLVGTQFTRGLSGGECKRTNIGMELVFSPMIILLDEPTSGELLFSCYLAYELEKYHSDIW
ncbi:unnamed protein product, partial [Didymodactylos carnosus]